MEKVILLCVVSVSIRFHTVQSSLSHPHPINWLLLTTRNLLGVLVRDTEFHWVNFRFAELDALLLLNGIEPSTAYTYDETSHGKDDAFLLITLPGMSVAVSMCERSVLIKAIYELWCYGSSLVGAIDEAKQLPKTFLDPYLSEDKSWSVNVDSHCKSYSMSEKEKCRNHFRFLDFKGKVNLDDADVQLWVLLDYSQANRNIEDGTEEIGTPAVPCYLGRLLSRGGMKDELKKYDLKKRLYLGPTSLDPSLALIMANMGGVKKGHLAFDPFAGTASILVALAHFGAKCFGSDIDPRVLRGQMYAGSADQSSDPTKRDIFENFSAYSLEKPELIRMDNHLLDRHLQIIGSSGVVSIGADGSRGCDSTALPCSSSGITASSGSSLQKNVLDGMFDVIVTDPPYGIRAGAKKSGKRKQVDYTVSADRRLDHIPSTQHYAVEEVMLDLLHTAARLLVCGGRLVYLIPTVLDFSSKDLPTHPCLSFIRLCEQQLSTRHGRHAVLMVKHRDYSDALEEEFSTYKKVVLSGQDIGFGSLMTRLEAALSVNAYDNESVLKKCSNSSVKRKESKIRRAKRREEEGPGAAYHINKDDALPNK